MLGLSSLSCTDSTCTLSSLGAILDDIMTKSLPPPLPAKIRDLSPPDKTREVPCRPDKTSSQDRGRLSSEFASIFNEIDSFVGCLDDIPIVAKPPSPIPTPPPPIESPTECSTDPDIN